MSAVKDLFDQIMKAIDKKTKKAGTNYTGKVTRVEGDTAYVQFDGSAINDTPVKMSIDAKPGDSVRIMVQGGKAWLTGNDTAPPTNDTVVINEIKEESSHIKETTNQVTLAVGTKMDSDMGNRKSSIVVDSGKIEFKSNTLVIDSDNFKLEEDGDATFSGTLDSAGGTFKGRVRIIGDNDYSTTNIHIGWDTQAPPIFITESAKPTNWGGNTEVGSHYASFAVFDGAAVTAYTNISAENGYDHSSDRRIKRDIERLDGLDLVMRLKPVTFKFKQANDDKIHYGFIAQDVQEVMPDTVTETDGVLGLKYMEFIAPAIAAIKEQQLLIQELVDRIDMLERRVDDGK